MKRRTLLIVGFTFLCLVAYVSWTQRIAIEVHPNRSLTVDDATRTYRLVVPHNLPDFPAIVFAFHGMGDSPQSMAAYSKLDRLAADNGFILVYPSGVNADWTVSTPTEVESNQDVQFFDKLLEHIADNHAIDLNRVYVLGFSNGAAFARLLSYARPKKIAAVVAHSGPRIPQLSPPENAPPIMMLVGDEDFFAGSVKADAQAIEDLGQDVDFLSIPGLGHRWSVARNAEMWQFLSRRSLPK